ncbi:MULTISPECIES: ATP synthase F1 subunit alpha [Jonquetella]|uniref:ATP synthase F1 subunit alpha n=1 Tax=Jonquetella TaxID=428711 RepID=UPI0001B91379|nr:MULTISPECIES: ATP synthase F1 subunit alpha [Jonquetella]EEX48773.1 hypothetical protein GCWU000246_00485 [Jonquetella anthropi E3_33 E1]ERL24024.1 ATP synthase alpha/beta family, nucleotide-binding domain protein [Jonquetella sp. BV3C21]
MSLSRVGSRRISRLEGTVLWVDGLRSAHLNDLVTVVNGRGEQFIGRVTALHGRQTRVRLDDAFPGMSPDDLTVWLGADEPDLPSKLPVLVDQAERTLVPFSTGVPALDALFPLYRGDRILLTAPTQEAGLWTASRLLYDATSDGQTPLYVAIGTPRSALAEIRGSWDDLGLDENNLFAAPCDATAFRSLAPLRAGAVRAVELAQSGQPVCLIIRDLDAWFDLYQEKLLLRGAVRSVRGALNSFHGMVCQILDMAYQWRNRLTVVALLSDWADRGSPSPLWGLRAYFDLAVHITRSETVGLDGETSHWRDTPQRTEAAWLRRQFKALSAEISSLRRWGDEVPPDLASFQSKLNAFLALRHAPEGRTPVSLAWEVLSWVDEERLRKIPRPLLRDRLSSVRARRDGDKP